MWKLGFRRLKNTLFAGKSRGATLIEVVIAIVVLGFIVAAVAPAMVLISDAQVRQNQVRVAQSLTSSQFEYIKSQYYIPGNDSSLFDTETGYRRVKYLEVARDGPLAGYGMQVWAYPIDPQSHERLVDVWFSRYGTAYDGQDEGVQEIEIKVYGYRYEYGDADYILKTVDYKVDRSLQIAGYTISR